MLYQSLINSCGICVCYQIIKYFTCCRENNLTHNMVSKLLENINPNILKSFKISSISSDTSDSKILK